LQLIEGEAPAVLQGLERPDAVFIGGGLSEAAFDAAWAALKPLGRLVANAVTIESEQTMLALRVKHGGELAKISVARAEAVGRLSGWKPAMTVTQWSLIKR
jgi:precorrin-6Y C5,15-methyltransferase (decarboxylating)